MNCHKCNHADASEYFEADMNGQDGKVFLCAKCYSEAFLASPPYFRNWYSNLLLKIPMMEHYIAAHVVKFLVQHQYLISCIIESQHKGRLPSSVSINVTNLETEIGYFEDGNYEQIKNTYFTKLILLWKEMHKSLDLSLNLAFNNYDRAAVAELRFVFEKYIDFAYLLLPSVSVKKTKEINFSDWIAGSKFKSTMRQRCDYFNTCLSYKPYDLYGYLCKGSHGSMTFLRTEDVVFSNFDDPYDFFKYSRWFSLFLWVLELIHDFNLMFSTEFNITGKVFDMLQASYRKILNRHKEHLDEIKANQFFIVEYPKHEITYWLDFERLVRHKCKGNCPKGVHKKLLDDYLFSFSLANHVR